jgi:hypothetical protein
MEVGRVRDERIHGLRGRRAGEESGPELPDELGRRPVGELEHLAQTQFRLRARKRAGPARVGRCQDQGARNVRVAAVQLECAVRLVAAAGTHPQRLEALLDAAERFCVNLDTLSGGTDVATHAALEVAG